MRQRALRTPGLRTLRRPIAEAPATGGVPTPEFDLAYLRTGPRTYRRTPDAAAPASGTGSLPVVIIPGGPGLASAVPYPQLRSRAARRGLEVIMVEHRGVGLSRHDLDGTDLPPEAMRIRSVVEDLAAVLAAEGIEKAVIVGSSYGTYVAQAFAATYPERVGGLVLDSPMLSTADEDLAREYSRDLLYFGTIGSPETRKLAAKTHDLVESGDVDESVLGRDVRIIYEFAGPGLLDQYLNQLRLGRARLTRGFLDRAGSGDVESTLPYYMEFDLVGEIAFRELIYFAAGDGRIFDQGHEFQAIREKYSPYAGEPYDLAAALPGLNVPVLVLSGDRDLRTPRPVAEKIVSLAPQGMLITLADQGHSALDTHELPVITAAEAMATGRVAELAWRPDRFDVLPRVGGPSRHLNTILAATLLADRLVPAPSRTPR